MAVVFSAGTVISGSGTGTPILMRRLNGDYGAITSGSTFSMTSGRGTGLQPVNIAESRGLETHATHSGSGQSLTVYVNGTARLTALPDIDDTWQGGEVGLIVRSQASQAMSFDNFKVFYDLNAEGTDAETGSLLAVSRVGSSPDCKFADNT